MIEMTTAAADLVLLDDAALERLQLLVNGEVAVRIQNTRLAKRMGAAITEAQAAGFTDAQVDEMMADAKTAARGKPDPSKTPPMPVDPPILNPGDPVAKPVPATTKPTTKGATQ